MADANAKVMTPLVEEHIRQEVAGGGWLTPTEAALLLGDRDGWRNLAIHTTENLSSLLVDFRSLQKEIESVKALLAALQSNPAVRLAVA